MKFESYNIAPEIKRSLKEQRFNRPTDIQFKSIPPILKGEDVLAVAQTGTGKTAAFVIPILHELQQRKNTMRPGGVKCLVMAPTHELTLQITDVFNTLGAYLNITTMALIGSVEQDPQIKQLEDGVEIVVATPGRMFDLVSQGHLNLHRVEILVLDEADHMLDLGFIKDINDLMKLLPKKRQTLFFSATIDQKIKALAYSLVKNAIRIQISPKNPVAKNITHSVVHIAMDDKRFFLERVINENAGSKILVFVRTKVRAERVKKAMERVGIDSETIHSDRTHKERKEVMDHFRSGKNKILIATDISARGIDIPNVDYVVNYDLPDESEKLCSQGWTNRKGNTKRFSCVLLQ